MLNLLVRDQASGTQFLYAPNDDLLNPSGRSKDRAALSERSIYHPHMFGGNIYQLKDWVRAPIAINRFMEALDLVRRERSSWLKDKRGSIEVPYLGGKFEFHLQADLHGFQKNRLKNDPKRYFKDLIELPDGYGFHTPMVLAALSKVEQASGLKHGEAAYCVQYPGGSGHGGGDRAFAGLVDMRALKTPWWLMPFQTRDSEPFDGRISRIVRATDNSGEPDAQPVAARTDFQDFGRTRHRGGSKEKV